MFSCEFCWISKHTFFTEHFSTTASKWTNFECLYVNYEAKFVTVILLWKKTKCKATQICFGIEKSSERLIRHFLSFVIGLKDLILKVFWSYQLKIWNFLYNLSIYLFKARRKQIDTPTIYNPLSGKVFSWSNLMKRSFTWDYRLL